MPVGNAEPQVVVHALAFHQFFRVVVTKREWVFRVRTFVINAINFGKALIRNLDKGKK